MVGGKNVNPTAWSDKQIGITIPADVQPGKGDIVVTNDNGNSSQAYSSTVGATT
jgi:uncharacterized protein (TIGR03437 family)